ncbi:general secretion pathway protein L [Rhodoblastus acidophilus]|uniref:PilN domain-containing protein n=1 Tax=Rhodoblastus acidophilus TaxID=1074 RepID=UPI00222557DB|nr:PilN domain-containing protein [Rhodoblastus acidophilus]MCW2318873.1 general secretion pathway protein L [Rhodoblastus acidophilus]
MKSALEPGGPHLKIGSSLPSLGLALRRFLEWELREAKKLLPRALHSWALRHGPRAAVTCPGAAELVVADAPNSPGFRIAGTEIAAGSLEDALSRRKVSREELAIVLELPAKSFLTRRLELPRAALSQLDAVVATEIELKTPFDPGALFIQTSIVHYADSNKSTVTLTLLRRDFALAALDGSGLTIDDLSVIRSAGGAGRFEITLGKVNNHRRFFGAAGALVALATLLVAIGLSVDFWRQGEKTAELDASIAELAAEASKIRPSADRARKESYLIEQLHEARRRNSPLTVLWEEISRLTPDSAWISDLRLTEDKDGERSIELVGLARSAVDLPLLYGRSRYFSEATLTAPITLDTRERMESFSLRLKIRRAPPLKETSP